MSHPNGNNASGKLSPLAVASTVLGILGFVTLWILGGLLLAGAGAVLGHLALHDIRFSGGRHTGKRLAQLGLFISYATMAVFPLIGAGAIASLPAIKEFRKSQMVAKSDVSQKHASRLFIACEQYSRANGGKYPREWNQLAGAYLSESEIRLLLTSPYPNSSGEAFELVPHERPVLRGVESSVVVIQENAPATVENVAIVYADGKIDLIANPNRYQ